MNNVRFPLSTLAFTVASAVAGIAHASTPNIAQANPPTARHAPHHGKPRAADAPRATATDRLHQHVVAMRSAEQRRWIASELRHGQLAPLQAASLRSWVIQLDDQQRSLTRRGHETLEEALAISHEEDLLDWSIRTGNLSFRPERVVAVASAGAAQRRV